MRQQGTKEVGVPSQKYSNILVLPDYVLSAVRKWKGTCNMRFLHHSLCTSRFFNFPISLKTDGYSFLNLDITGQLGGCLSGTSGLLFSNNMWNWTGSVELDWKTA